MAPDDPDDLAARDPALSHLYRLAEGIVNEITGRSPDWCQIARDAQQLAEHADQKCCGLNNDSDR
jgi:ABC-type transporter Mla subunit MlaD